MNRVRTASFAADCCVFSSERPAAVWRQAAINAGQAGSAKAAEETWASATRMPRSAEPPQNFCLKKPKRCAFLRKKFKGMLTDLGNSGKRSHDCPGSHVSSKIFRRESTSDLSKPGVLSQHFWICFLAASASDILCIHIQAA